MAKGHGWGGAKGHGWGGEGLRETGGEGTRVGEYMEGGCRRTHSNAHTIPASPAKRTLKLVLSISTGASAILEQELVKMFSEKKHAVISRASTLLIEHPQCHHST